MLRRLLIGCAVWLVTATAASAIFAPFDVINVPVDRLARNLEALIAERPADSRLWLNLARLHAMAYALKVELVPVVRGNEAGGVFLGRAQMPFTPKPAANAAAGRVARAHLQRALDAYRAALALDRKNPVVHLGYAWCLARAGRTPDAIAEYRQVLDLAWEVERKPIKIYEGAQSITEEAASLLIPLLDPKRDADEIARLRARVETINRQAMRWVTPIAVPLEDGLSPSDFLDGRASVAFDADGSGERRPWTWITPQAGWLVHDIHRTGHVTSALQLFGSVTWWLFWENGDEALQALDDDRDGVLG
jgi:tetratricopeptide (TPR) repeat protein